MAIRPKPLPTKQAKVAAPVKSAKAAPAKPVAQVSDHPPLYYTLSLLGLLLASLRSRNSGVIDAAYANIGGFMMDMQNYGLYFPGMELDRVRTHIVQHKWKEANASLKQFSDEFSTEFRKLVAKDSNVKAEAVSLLNTFLDMISVRNPERWGKMETTALNKLKYLGNPILNQLWRVHIEGDQSDEMDRLKEIVAEVRGRDARPGDDARTTYMLSFGERERLRESNPELNKRYNAASNSAIKKYRAALRNWILDKGGKPQPLEKARDAMEAQGFVLHELPQELDDLNIGEDGFYYTDAGHRIVNRPQPGAIILGMNPNYSPEDDQEWIFQYRTEEGEPTYAYTEKYKRESKTEKFEKVEDNLDVVPGMRPKWLADLKGTNYDKKILATITDLLYHFAARIGGAGNYTKGVGNTYGISTLEVKHVKKFGGGYKLDYFGKSGQHQIHTINASDPEEKRFIPIIQGLLDGKKKDDPLFTFKDGKPVSPSHVRNYFKTLGIPINPHMMRSIRGTKLMKEIIANTPAKTIKSFDQSGAEKFFKKEAEKVGELLGHFNQGKTTATTAITSYISPEWAQSWFKGNGWRVPLWLKITARDQD